MSTISPSSSSAEEDTSAAAAAQLHCDLCAVHLCGHCLRHCGGHWHSQLKAQAAQGGHEPDQHPHDQPRHRHRCVPFSAVRLRGHQDAGPAGEPDLLDPADRPHHLQPALCGAECDAEAAPDGFLPGGCGDGLRLHPSAVLLQGDHP